MQCHLVQNIHVNPFMTYHGMEICPVANTHILHAKVPNTPFHLVYLDLLHPPLSISKNVSGLVLHKSVHPARSHVVVAVAMLSEHDWKIAALENANLIAYLGSRRGQSKQARFGEGQAMSI